MIPRHQQVSGRKGKTKMRSKGTGTRVELEKNAALCRAVQNGSISTQVYASRRSQGPSEKEVVLCGDAIVNVVVLLYYCRAFAVPESTLMTEKMYEDMDGIH